MITKQTTGKKASYIWHSAVCTR